MLAGQLPIVQAEFNTIDSSSLRPQAHLEHDKRSEHGLLTEAFGIAVDAALAQSNSPKQSEISKSAWGVAEFASGFVKAAPLFMGPGRGTVLSTVLYGLDEVHSGDDRRTQLTDFALGGAKGAANKLVMDKFGSSEISLAGKGIAIGGSSSFVDSALTRTNWINQKTGDADIKAGLEKTAFQTTFGASVGMVAFPLGQALGGKVAPSVQRLLGTSLDGNIVAAVTTGSAFGFTSGVVSETAGQLYSGQFDPLAIARRGLLEGLSTGAAGGVGHRFSAQYELTQKDLNPQFKPAYTFSENPARIGLTLAGGDRLEAEGAQHSVSAPPEAVPEVAQGRIAPVRDEAAIAAMPGNEIFPPRESLDGRPIPGSYSEKGLWHAKPTLEGYSDAQVRAATAHLADHYILGKPQTLSDFLQLLKPVFENWHNNNTEVLKKVAAEEESLRLVGSLQIRYNKVLKRVIGQLHKTDPEFDVNELKESPTSLRDFLHTPAATELGVTKTGTRAQLANQLIEAQTQYADHYKQTSELLQPRLQQIQKVVDQFTNEHGLSRVAVATIEGAGHLGDYINGNLRLQRQYFTGRDTARLARTFYHELSHHEQYSLMIRRLADKLDIAEAPTRSQRHQLKEEYTLLLNRRLPDKFADSVLAVRQGVRLTEPQAAAADALLQTSRYIKTDYKLFGNAGNAFWKVSRLLTDLNGENAESVTTKIEQGAEDKSDLLASTHIARLFPSVPPPKVSADSSLPEQTRSNIVAGLKEWHTDLNRFRMADYTAYRGRKMEWDAWLLTSLVRSTMDSKPADLVAPAP